MNNQINPAVKSGNAAKTNNSRKIHRKARNPIVKKNTLDNAQTNVVEKIKKIADMAFASLYFKSGLTEEAFATALHPVINNASTVSKILNGIDNRHASFKILAALHFKFGFSIDKMLDDALEIEKKKESRK